MRMVDKISDRDLASLSKVIEQTLIKKEVYDQLPKKLQLLTEAFEGREKDIILVSSLCVLSNCIPNIQGVYRRNTIYPHLYGMIVAPPASGKGVMNRTRALIEPIHKQIRDKSQKLKNECEAKKKIDKSDKTPCPKIAIKIVPANISTSELYRHLDQATYGLLMMESEADSLSIMMNNEWSNYSDVFRKCFHHETISLSRKGDDIYIEVAEPKLSVLLSGTPDQLAPLLKSRDNGLFSRFIIYTFDEVSQFKNVFEIRDNDSNKLFEDLGIWIAELYNKLTQRDNPIMFKFSNEQESKFVQTFREMNEKIISLGDDNFIPNLRRHGLIAFRIAMILSFIRLGDEIIEKDEVICQDVDFENTIILTRTLLNHSFITFKSMPTEFISEQEEQILDSLKKEFVSDEILLVGANLGISKRTIYDKLQRFQKRKLIKKVAQGKYKKL